MRRPAALLVVLLAMSVAAPATAQTDRGGRDEPPPDSDRPVDRELDRLKDATLVEIDRRLARLNRLTETIAAAPRLTPGHREALATQTESSTIRLSELRTAVATADSLAGLGALVPRIVSDHWVYALAAPRAHEVIAADAIDSVSSDLASVHEAIQATIDAAAMADLDVGPAQAALFDARGSARAAGELARSVPPRVLPLTADQMPDRSSVLVEAAQDLGTAFERLSASVRSTQRSVQELRAAVGQSDA